MIIRIIKKTHRLKLITVQYVEGSCFRVGLSYEPFCSIKPNPFQGKGCD